MDSDGNDDTDLFRRAMADVRRLRAPDTAVPSRVRRTPVRGGVDRDRDRVLAESLAMSPFEALLETGEELLYRSPALSTLAFRRLRRGELAVEDELDLHGLTATQARVALAEFLHECARRRLGCVRVVHGKGMGSGPRGPVLKFEVNRCLRLREDVLGFTSAPPRDGGTGAVYVLLRRR